MTFPQKDINRQLYRALKCIARLLLAGGVNYKRFDEVAKRAFVDVATSDYGIRGRMANITRVATLTGLTRKQVKMLREECESQREASSKSPSVPADVLHDWHTDSSYLHRDGSPREIKYVGPSISFTDLVRRSGVDVSPAAVLTELKRMGAVVELPDGSLQARQRHYVPADLENLVAGALEYGVTTVAGTVAFNAMAKRDGVSRRRFQRTVDIDSLPDDLASEVKVLLEERLLRLSEELDDALSKYSENKKEPQADRQGRRVGVGLYYFEEE